MGHKEHSRYLREHLGVLEDTSESWGLSEVMGVTHEL